MEASVTLPLPLLVSIGVAWAGVIAGAVWLITRQATENVRQHLDQHAEEESKMLSDMAQTITATVSRVQVLHERVEGLAAQARTSPSLTDVHTLAVRMEQIAGTITAMQVSVNSIEKHLGRIEHASDRHEDVLLQRRP